MVFGVQILLDGIFDNGRRTLPTTAAARARVGVGNGQIKKSIGAQRSVIVTQFLVESSVLSAAGGVIGIAIGFAVSLILGKALYGLILLPSAFVTLGSFGFSILIGVGFGLYPAIKASGLQPVDALRSD